MDIKKTSKDGVESFIYTSNYIDFGDLHPIREEIQNFLKYHVDDKRLVDSILLTVTEVLSNIIKHTENPANYIKLTINVGKDTIEVDIADNGSPFVEFDNKVELAVINHKNVNAGYESGFGIELIFSLNDSVEYIDKHSSSDKLNHFITKKLIDYKKDDDDNTIKKIFLIDDEPIALQIHAIMLQDTYEVHTFEKGQDALEAFGKHKPDLIISDLVMPDISGAELRKRLSKLENGNTIPFIFLSGNQYEENSMYISKLGIDDYLTKPIAEDKLKTIIARLLQRSKQIKHAVQGQLNRDITEILKPQMPENRYNWKFILKSQVADSGGGDFVLYKDTKDSLVTILSDVMGHDAQAKFFSYTYAGYLRSLFRNNAEINDGAEFLKYLSKSVGEDPLLESVVMTCQYFRVFPDGRVSIASAGHPKPLLIRKNKEARMIQTTGPIPGLTIDNQYKIVTEQLEVGDRILFMTDGFIDIFEQTGMATETLVETIKTGCNEYHEHFDEYLWKSFIARQEASCLNRDDATIIIAEYGA